MGMYFLLLLSIRKVEGMLYPKAHFISMVLWKWKWRLSVVYDSLWPYGLKPTRLFHPWDFLGKNYWSGLPFPSPGDLPHPGIEPGSSGLQADAFLSEPPGKNMVLWMDPNTGSLLATMLCLLTVHGRSLPEYSSQTCLFCTFPWVTKSLSSGQYLFV